MLSVTCYVNKLFKRSLDAANLNRGLSWVCLREPTDAELGKLAKKIRIPMSELKEYIDPEERPRVEELKNWSLIIFKVPISAKQKATSSIAILFSENAVITLNKEPNDVIENLLNLPANKKIKYFERGADYFVFRLLDDVFSAYFKLLDEIEEHSSKIEHDILKRPEKIIMDDLFKIKKTIVHLHRALLANREVVAGIEKGYSRFVSKSMFKYFRELYNDCVQLIELEETQRDILTSLADIHLSVISTNLNKIMKTLTIIASFIWVPTLIAGIYGMNFFAGGHPYSMPEIRWVYGYPFALTLMAISIIITAIIFRKKGWL